METQSRRKFLGSCLVGTAIAAVAAALYPLYRYLAPSQSGTGTAKVTFAATEVPEGEAKFFEYAGSTGVVVRTKGGLIALSAVCTHLGCIVQWEKDKQDFLCPCHAGRYTPEGTVISGPPPRPLPKLPLTQAEGKIIIG
ncbi:QcrA and Rieske domain-containing protein [Geomesophilobacter sediminis]|uniref:Rieske 2Fe-2S domain-containing protein n=1 Tax=Geomesophilobacter sediminis TaxID=2798584 RepID=A0A8J7SAC1_9BACT|nr:Rieske 2Fe-2S domain-containing protein [Geomesophilobacter sediminis]MBJ6727251.1 Rieske 2Fe-2S domain-containing protein [Geomesophilobacter sediminis]